MNIYKVILKADKNYWPDWPHMEMYFTHRPTNDQIIQRLRDKIDPEIVHTTDNLPWIEWFIDKVSRYPIGDGSDFDLGSTRTWRDFPPAGTPLMDMTLHGQTIIHEIPVTENEPRTT